MKAPLKVTAVPMVSAASLHQTLDSAARLLAQAAQDGSPHAKRFSQKRRASTISGYRAAVCRWSLQTRHAC